MHLIREVNVSRSRHLSIILLASVLLSNCGGGGGGGGGGGSSNSSATADFAARCGAIGVIYCNGFDSAGDFAAFNGTLGTVLADTSIQLWAPDSSIKSSGNSSLRVDIPISYTGGDPGGFWVYFTPQPAGSTFYVQFQYRMTPGIQTESVYGSGGSGVKIFDIFAGTLTCQSGEITTEMPGAGGGEFVAYYDCGAGLHTNMADTAYTASSPPFLLQQNNESRGWNCSYDNQTNVAYPSTNNSFGANNGTDAGTGCLALPTNTWFTFYYKIHVGNSGTATSTVEAWYSANGLNYAKFINIPNLNMSPVGEFDGIYFKPYMSQRGGGSASTNNSVWYDDIIISTQPIVAPGSGTTSQLSPPTNLKVQ